MEIRPHLTFANTSDPPSSHKLENIHNVPRQASMAVLRHRQRRLRSSQRGVRQIDHNPIDEQLGHSGISRAQPGRDKRYC